MFFFVTRNTCFFQQKKASFLQKKEEVKGAPRPFPDQSFYEDILPVLTELIY